MRGKSEQNFYANKIQVRAMRETELYEYESEYGRK